MVDTEFRMTSQLRGGVTLNTCNEVNYNEYVTEFWTMNMSRGAVLARNDNAGAALRAHHALINFVKALGGE